MKSRLALLCLAVAGLWSGCAGYDASVSSSVYIGSGYYDSWGWNRPWYPYPPGGIGPPPPRPAHPIAPTPHPPVRPMPMPRPAMRR